jgi:hypothetical protein
MDWAFSAFPRLPNIFWATEELQKHVPEWVLAQPLAFLSPYLGWRISNVSWMSPDNPHTFLSWDTASNIKNM